MVEKNPRQVTKDFSIMGSTLRPGGNMNASVQIQRLKGGQPLTLVRQPTNEHDANAILVLWGTWPLGFVPRGLAAKLAPLMDVGVKIICRKAPNVLYGVCQIAYIEPEETEKPLTALPEGITQADIDSSTPMPSLNDSRRLRKTEEVPNDEPTADPADEPGTDL